MQVCLVVQLIITQGRQAITESRGRYRVHNFSKPVSVTHKQKLDLDLVG